MTTRKSRAYLRDELLQALSRSMVIYSLGLSLAMGLFAWFLVRYEFKGSIQNAFIGAGFAWLSFFVGSLIYRHIVIKNALDQLQQMSLHYEMGDQRLQQVRLQTIGELSAGIFHEINNPITSIDGYAFQIEEEIREPSTKDTLKTIQKANERVRYNVARVREMVQALKNFSRSSSLNTKYENVDVKKLIDESVLLMKPSIKAQKIEMVCKVPAEDLIIEGNYVQLSQVLVNFLSNAIDSVKEAKTKKLSAGFDDFGTHIEFFVEDSGPGVPDHVSERIFEAFFTTKDVGVGTGLGLSICQEIARNHQGRVGFKNLKDGRGRAMGARFYIHLPKQHHFQNSQPEKKVA